MKNIFKYFSLIFIVVSFSLISFAFADPNMGNMYMSGKITVTKDNAPASDANVIVLGNNVFTDSNGVAQLDNMMSGEKLVKVIYNNREYEQTVNIDSNNIKLNLTGNGNDVTPTAVTTLNNSSSSPNSSDYTILYFFIPLLLIILAIIFLVKKYHSKIDRFRYKLRSKRSRLATILGATGAFVLLGVVVTQSYFVVNTNKTYTLAENSKAATISTLPIPNSITKVQEDDSVLLSWQPTYPIGWFPSQDAKLSQQTLGFLIRWGVLDANNNFISTSDKYSEYSGIQLQPLDHTKTYGAMIATVDYLGNLSQFSPIVTFKTDSTRHDQLKAQDTAFFDDFTSSAGPFNELKWNFAASGCVDGGQAGQFINAQFHAHNQISDGYCDRGSVTSRPRAVFDFTGRQGTITFDQDGTNRRDDWYLDLQPASYGPWDMSGHIALNVDNPTHDTTNGSGPTTPIHTLRILQTGSSVGIHRFDDSGFEVAAGNYGTEAGCSYDQKTNFGNLDACSQDVHIVKNYRRHWVVKIKMNLDANGNPIMQNDPAGKNAPSPTVSVIITIDGVLVYSVSAVPFPEQKAYLDNVLFSYNTPKSNEPTSLYHWDNFGFDGPAPTTITHNYIDGVVGTGVHTDTFGANIPMATTGSPITKTVKIPDSISGTTASRLMFTIQMPGYSSYGWSSTDNVTINGNKVMFTNPNDVTKHPEFGGISKDSAPSGIMPMQFILNVPSTYFHIGDNIIVFNLTNAGIMNVHAEFDFPKASEPAYTAPIAVYPNLAYLPKNPDIGPNANFTLIGTDTQYNGGPGGNSIDPGNGDTGSISHPAGPYTGIIPVYLEAGGELALNGTGTNPGISEYQIVVDRKSIFSKKTYTNVYSPHVFDKYSLDTTKLCNGSHEIYLIAFNPNGTPSIPDYFQADATQNGQYRPVFITTSNSGQSTCTPLSAPTEAPLGIQPVYPVTVTSTPVPTTIASTSTLTPTPTFTPTKTPLPTPTATPTSVPTTIASTTTSVSCLCQANNLCSTSCSFNLSSNGTYPAQLSCTNDSLYSSSPTQLDKNRYCNRPNRTLGDADGNGIIEPLDYIYYVRVVNGGAVPAKIDTDFNGDGVTSVSDRSIVVQNIPK